MCVNCQGYYIKKIKPEEYDEILSVAGNHFDAFNLPTWLNLAIFDEVSKIQENYSNHIFTHHYECVDYDDMNVHDCYIMYIHVEI
jgi:hypothetical protein